MKSDCSDERLSRISTKWSIVVRAHAEGESQAPQVRGRVLERYCGAIFRYLLGAVRDADVAEELCQQFALKFMEGKLHRASPDRGRFRDYVKATLVNMVNMHYRERGKQASELPDQVAAPTPASVADFDVHWRTDVLEATWRALKQVRPVYHDLLRLRIDEPCLTSQQLADSYSQTRDRITAANVRKTLQRAHAKFAELLVDQVGESLDEPSVDGVESELQTLDLLKYCRSAFEKWASQNRSRQTPG